MYEPFWKRKNLYYEDGKCCYINFCEKLNINLDCKKKPEECNIWETLYDTEVQCDDLYFEQD